VSAAFPYLLKDAAKERRVDRRQFIEADPGLVNRLARTNEKGLAR
jgi:hypothetical protein